MTGLTDGATFALDVPAVPTAVWGRASAILWAAGEPLLIAAPTGVGKTTLIQQAILRRTGIIVGDLLGFPVAADTRPVLYVAADRPAQARRSLRRMVGENDRADLRDRLIVHEGRPAFEIARQPDALHDFAAGLGVGTVVIDSLKDVAGDLSDPAVGAGVNLALQAVVADGIEVAALHHQRKRQQGERKPRELDDVFGSVWLTAGAGSVVVLWGEAGDERVELRHLKQPAAKVGPLTLHIDHAQGLVHLDAEPGGLADEVAAFLAEHPGSTSTEIGKAVKSRRDDVERVLEAGSQFARVPPGQGRKSNARTWTFLPVPDDGTSWDKQRTQPAAACPRLLPRRGRQDKQAGACPDPPDKQNELDADEWADYLRREHADIFPSDET